MAKVIGYLYSVSKYIGKSSITIFLNNGYYIVSSVYMPLSISPIDVGFVLDYLSMFSTIVLSDINTRFYNKVY